MTVTALRGRLLDIKDNPFEQPEASCFTVHEDGMLLIEGGKITAAGPYATLRGALPDGVTRAEYRDAVITAGLWADRDVF